MDEFDLDKVLDELEQSEDKEQQCSSHDAEVNVRTASTLQAPTGPSLDYTDSCCDNNINGLEPTANQSLEDGLGQNVGLHESPIKLDISEADFAPSNLLSLKNSAYQSRDLSSAQNGFGFSQSSSAAESKETSMVDRSECVNDFNVQAFTEKEKLETKEVDQQDLASRRNGFSEKDSSESPKDPTSHKSFGDTYSSPNELSLDSEAASNMPALDSERSEKTQSGISKQDEQPCEGISMSSGVYCSVDQSTYDEIDGIAKEPVQPDPDVQITKTDVCDDIQGSTLKDEDTLGSQPRESYGVPQKTYLSSTNQETTSSGSTVESSKSVMNTAVSDASNGDTEIVENFPKTTDEPPNNFGECDSEATADTIANYASTSDEVNETVTENVKDADDANIQTAGKQTKPVGFGDISDVDLSRDELDQYLSTIGGPDNCTEYDSKPIFMDHTSVIQGIKDHSQEASVPDAEGDAGMPCGQEAPALDERRGSEGSVEKFLAPVVMSPGITTPIEDPGYSKVPGYIPELSVTMEEDVEELHVDHVQHESDKKVTSENGGISLKSEDVTCISSVNGKHEETTSSVQSENVQQGLLRNQVCSADSGGARPKEPSSTSTRISRPSSLLGLSTPDLPSLTTSQVPTSMGLPSVTKIQPSFATVQSTVVPQVGVQCLEPSIRDSGIVFDSNEVDSGASSPKDEMMNTRSMHDLINTQLAAQHNMPLMEKQVNLEIKQHLDGEQHLVDYGSTGDVKEQDEISIDDVQVSTSQTKCMDSGSASQNQTVPSDTLLLKENQKLSGPDLLCAPVNSHQTGQSPSPKQKRPSSLNILPQAGQRLTTDVTPAVSDPSSSTVTITAATVQPALAVAEDSSQDEGSQSQHDCSESRTGSAGHSTVTEPVVPSPPTSANINLAITQLGKVAPVWVPDAEAPTCMLCDARFTFTKRRHHCRACGKVFCNSCCNLRSKLVYMDNKEARVCSKCYQDLIRAQVYERIHQQGASPNPNNPSEYCSTVPPLQQAAGALNAPPPTVMVPSGVLRKDGNQRRAEGPKQVMFSDGIRPGGDLTELNGSDSQRPLVHRQTRKVCHVEKAGDKETSPRQRALSEQSKPICLIPEQGLPPVLLSTGVKGDFSIEENPDPQKILPKIRNTEDPEPVVFAINKNLFVLVKIVTLDCCVNRVCWCFSTKGMCTVGQDDIVIVLECLPDEKTIPRDIFCHMSTVYEEASKGNTVSHLGHTIFAQGFLDSRDHSGFLYINASYQCLQKLILPQPPFIFGILLQRWETPWAKVFPIRLMLRLGAEYRYYPCPLISVRFRKPVFGEIGHTIMNLLADFRNYQYMLPQVPGVTIHMGDKQTFINFPRNRYNNIMKVLTNSNDHVMALGANFSLKADSHLVCLQNEDGSYQTQAINIQNKPRKVTGASFVVFNGAFKQTSGLRAKSSIIEDGLMVQITAKMMSDMKEAMKNMSDYTIECGTLHSLEPEETITIKWVEDDRYFNIGIKSPINNMPMDGIESIRIHTSTDFAGEKHMIRWTECFFVQTPTEGSSRDDPVDLSRLAESLAHALSVALVPYLDKLQGEHLSKIGLRATIDPDKTCYEVGSNGTRFPDEYMDVLDDALIPVIHNAATHNQDGPVILELIFHIIE